MFKKFREISIHILPMRTEAHMYIWSWQAKYKQIIPMKIIMGIPMSRSSKRANINQNRRGHGLLKMAPIKRNR